MAIADVSIRNANVFCELGICHALRDKWTFMIRCKGDPMPFDNLTDRYFWQSVLKVRPRDRETNEMLATIYQRLGERAMSQEKKLSYLKRSNQCVRIRPFGPRTGERRPRGGLLTDRPQLREHSSSTGPHSPIVILQGS